MNRPEQALQISLVAHLRARLPAGWLVHHSANGGYRTKVEAARFRQMGVVAGFPDLMVIGPGRVVVFLELKAPPKRLKSGRLSDAGPPLSDAQLATIETLAAAGWPVLIVRSIEDATKALERLGVPLRGRSQ